MIDSSVISQYKLVELGLVGGGLAVGAVGGYFFAKKKFRKLADEEVASVKETYSKIDLVEHATDENPTVTIVEERIETLDEEIQEGLEAAAELRGYKEKLDALSYGSNIVAGVNIVPASKDPDLRRDPRIPYTITVEEYMGNDSGYEQSTFTYWEGGNGVLVDEREIAVDDIEGTVGSAALTTFGLQEGDPNTIYVRNDYLGADFEIVRTPRDYNKDVLGFVDPDDEPRRMRDNDE